ncbi:DUF6382 domain-containing protein [Lachnospiraceae bacterium 62-35]
MGKFTFENQGADSYLVYEITKEENLDSFAKGMLQNNEIEGVIKPTFTQKDTQQYLKYNITSKLMLSEYFRDKLTKEKVVKIFSSIAAGLENAEEYMLLPDKFLLDADKIYVDISKKEASIIFLPVDEFKQDNSLKDFFKKLLADSIYDENEDLSYVGKSLNFLNQSKGDSPAEIKRFMDKLLTERGASARAAQKESRPDPVNVRPVPPNMPINQEPIQEPILQSEPPRQAFTPQPESRRPVIESAPATPARMPQQQRPIPTPPAPGMAPAPGMPPAPGVPPVPGMPSAPGVPPMPGIGAVPGRAPIPGVPPTGVPVPEKRGGLFGGKSDKQDKKAAKAAKEAEKAAKKAAKKGGRPVPGMPSAPGVPPMPGMPQGQPMPKRPIPGMPPAPGVPPMPEIGAVPGRASMPGMPPASGVPSMPGNPPQEKKGFHLFKGKDSVQSAGNRGGRPIPQAPAVGQPAAPIYQNPQPEPIQTVPQPSFQPEPVQPQPMVHMAGSFSDDDNRTIIVGGGDDEGSTMVLGYSGDTDNSTAGMTIASITRRKNGQSMMINKSVFHMGKESSFADFFIGDNRAISSAHADIICDEGAYFIRDMNSLNHTFVNGVMVTAGEMKPLQSGDIIRLADEEFDFRIN